MNRLLLTLLALLTGFAVSGGTAEARLCAAAEAQVLSQTEATRTASVSRLATKPRVKRHRVEPADMLFAAVQVPLSACSVLIRVDRAHE